MSQPASRFRSISHRNYGEDSSGEEHRYTELSVVPSSIASDRKLPVLANANDIREVVQFLRKRPSGVTLVEALTADKRRIFEPRKILAYEFWNILIRRGDRLQLSRLGWEISRALEPEAIAYQKIISDVPAYHDALKWIHEQNLELVTHVDISQFWRMQFPQHLESEGATIEASVLSFFHLCQAADLGTLTIGKRGQPSRLRVGRKELDRFLEAEPVAHSTLPFDPQELPEAERSQISSQKERVYVSHRRSSEMANQICVALELAGIESQVTDRSEAVSLQSTLLEMKGCSAGVFLVTPEEVSENGESNIILQVGAGLGLFDGRVLLVLLGHHSFVEPLLDLPNFKVPESQLGWPTALELVKQIKNLKSANAVGEIELTEA